MSNCVHGPRVVRLDVLTANIRNESFVPVWGAIHDQTALARCAPFESFRSEKNSELQWHIEPGQAIGLLFDFCSRDVVNAVITPGNQPVDIFNPNFARIGQFQCASGNESTRRHAKDDRVQERLVFFVEWTVNEHASAGGRRHSGSTVLSHQEHVLAQGGAYSRLILFWVGSLQFCDFSDGLSDHTLGNRSTSPHVWNWAILRFGHASKYGRRPALSLEIVWRRVPLSNSR